jgi:hypothetical protein
VWLSTAVIYTVLAAFAGAREPLPAEAKPEADNAPPPSAAPVEARAARTTIWWVSGVLTLATLLAFLVLPFSVYGAGATEWPARLAAFKLRILLVTAVYFVAGVVWMKENEKRRAV